ncbi:MAG: hypothetical protein JWN14_2752 [Chthonomonadales bacterium]|nr:hypothetical protein [Chthonomonadales bacterium]
MKLRLTRRQVLTGATLAAAAGGVAGRLSALEGVALGPRTGQTGGDTLVVIFLRGGADGLNIVVPYGDADYYRLRPSLGIPGPKDTSATAAGRCLELSDFFGLHPALAPLLPLYQEGKLAAVHAIGSGDQTRSHFEAMATMERGLARDSGAANGWLARHLTVTGSELDSPLRAVSITETVPDSLRGAPNVAAMLSLDEFRLTAPNIVPTGNGNKVFHRAQKQAAQANTPTRADAIAETLRGMYGGTATEETKVLTGAGAETLKALDAVKRLDPNHYKSEFGVIYPKSEMANGLKQVACLLKGDVGLEIACLDLGGWDTHVAQGREAGWQAGRLGELAQGLGAFTKDLGPRLERTTIMVMTEFGRRAAENSGLGTDHGRASCMFLIGGGVKGGKVYANWPGLGPTQLEGPGDLHVTTDYRDVLAEIVTRRLKNTDLDAVFPEYTPHYHDIFRAV